MRRVVVANSLPANLEELLIVIAPKQTGTEHAHANHSEITLFPLFFKEDPSSRAWILGHEIGHWFFNNSSFSVKKSILTFERGTGFWQDAMTSEEGFANMFAQYLYQPQVLKNRYLEQYKILDNLIGTHKSGILRFISGTI